MAASHQRNRSSGLPCLLSRPRRCRSPLERSVQQLDRHRRGGPNAAMNSGSDRLAAVPSFSHPMQFVLIALAGWFNQQQRDVVDYLVEENRVLREQIGARRLRFTDDQRRRLATKARTLGRRLLRECATVVTPDTL